MDFGQAVRLQAAAIRVQPLSQRLAAAALVEGSDRLDATGSKVVIGS